MMLGAGWFMGGMRVRWAVLGALGLAVLVLLVLFGIYWFAFGALGWRHRERAERIPRGAQYDPYREKSRAMIRALAAQPCERMTIRARDGVRLSGRYYRVAEGAPLEIAFHGYRGSALRDFCGGSAMARAQGRNVLLVDQRAHGESGGHTISLGVRERWDCVDWANAAVARWGPGVKIVLSGVSMGAATVLMASALPLPENVVGIVADCPFSSPEAIVRKICRDGRLPAAMMPLVRLSARLFGRFRLDEASAVAAVRRARVPLLLIHGSDDRFVPCGMSREIAAAAADAELVIVPGAGHALSYMVDEARYVRAVDGFVRRALARSGGQSNLDEVTT